MSKKFLYILPFALSALFAAGFVFARELEVSYPAFGNMATPQSTRMLLPDYVKYIFTFSIAISGLVAFGVIFFSGFEYFTSGGNPTKLSDAKNKIIQALIGIVILLGSYLLLTTINPELIIINPITAKGEGVVLYESPAACDIGKGTPEAAEKSKVGNYLKLGVSANLWGKDKDKDGKEIEVNIEGLATVGAVFRYKPSKDLDVNLYDKISWEGNSVPVGDDPTGCVNVSLSPVKSVELNWKNPGVYLCENADRKKCSVYNTDTPTIPKDFEDKVGYIYFKNPDDGTKYGAVLHEGRDFGRTCNVFTNCPEGNTSCVFSAKTSANNFPADGVSSITVFQQNTNPQGAGITLFSETGHAGKQWGPKTTGNYDSVDLGDFEDKARSMTLEGDYMALLFRDPDYKHECSLFKEYDLDLRNDNVTCVNPGWDCRTKINTVSSLKIIPIKK